MADPNADGLATAVSRARAALVNDAFRTDRLPAPTLQVPAEVLRVLVEAGAAVLTARALPEPDDDVARLRRVVMEVRTTLARSPHRHFRGMRDDCSRCLALEVDRVLSETRPRAGDGPCLDEYDPDGHGSVQCEAPIGHQGAHRCNVGGWGWSWPVTT